MWLHVLHRLWIGICYAKNHLLAAILRSQGIPTRLVYQVLIKDAPNTVTVLHGFNAAYITALSKWLRMDARGNTGGIDAPFSLHHEKLAFETDESKSEFIYETLFVNKVLYAFDDSNRYPQQARAPPLKK